MVRLVALVGPVRRAPLVGAVRRAGQEPRARQVEPEVQADTELRGRQDQPVFPGTRACREGEEPLA